MTKIIQLGDFPLAESRPYMNAANIALTPMSARKTLAYRQTHVNQPSRSFYLLKSDKHSNWAIPYPRYIA